MGIQLNATASIKFFVIQMWHLFQGGVYLKSYLFLANSSTVTDNFNFKKQKDVLVLVYKVIFLYRSQISLFACQYYCNTNLMSDMLSQHQNWYIQKDLYLVHSKFPTAIEALIFVCFLSLLLEWMPHQDGAFIQGWHLLTHSMCW